MRRDAAVTEVIGFIVILMLVISSLMIWALVALPDQVERSEVSHVEEIQLAFGEFKTGVDTLWLANNTGVVRKAVFGLAPGARVTEASILPNLLGSRGTGTLWLEDSTKILPNGSPILPNGSPIYQLRYRSSNQYAENIEILYVAGAVMVKKGFSDYQMVLNPPMGDNAIIPVLTEPSQSISGDVLVIAEYQLNGIYSTDHPISFSYESGDSVTTSRIAVFEVALR